MVPHCTVYGPRGPNVHSRGETWHLLVPYLLKLSSERFTARPGAFFVPIDPIFRYPILSASAELLKLIDGSTENGDGPAR